jgi:mycofactocin glycosyltransferase
VDDGSTDDTAPLARDAGASVISLTPGKNPAAARNAGASAARGSILLFLDADCRPLPQWLAAHLEAQGHGMLIVGGSLALPPGLSWTARADYFASAYHVHPGRPPGPVPSHSPANLSVARSVFQSTVGFTQTFPVADGHEELAWQSEAREAGVSVYFDPRATAEHFNRSGLGNLVRRSYRWGYSTLEAKALSGATRARFWYGVPLIPILAAYPVALLETLYITFAWIAAGRWEALQYLPLILLSRATYATAFMIGGSRWLLRRPDSRGVRAGWR